MQSQPESIQICVAESQHNPINKAVDNSGETTTTTSVSEFDEMASSTSGGSECVVPFHPESGQLNSEPCLDPISASVFGYNEVASSGLELECTVPSHAETGQPGGEACRYMISIDTYPLNCTQISPPQVCENLESRTKDNREHQDMDTKVQTFIAEHNNYES